MWRGQATGPREHDGRRDGRKRWREWGVEACQARRPARVMDHQGHHARLWRHGRDRKGHLGVDGAGQGATASRRGDNSAAASVKAFSVKSAACPPGG